MRLNIFHNLNPSGIFLCFLLCIPVLCSSCAGTENNATDISENYKASSLFWPPPPQQPRIQMVKTLSGSRDMGVSKSWLMKALDSLLGKEDAQEMLRPYGVYADLNRVYVTDPGSSSVHVFDLRHRQVMQIASFQKDRFISPIGIAADKTGNIYISDSLLRRVIICDKEGKYLYEIGSPEYFARPAGIAIDDERIYIVDTHGHKVLVFSVRDARFLFQFGKNGTAKGEFHYPTHIFAGRDGFIYVTDSLNFRIQIFDRNGSFVSSFGKLGDGTGDLSKPKGVAVDSEGHIYVSDAHFDNVQIFDRTGRLLLVVGKSGRREGEMFLPAGVYIDTRDRIYVADSYNRRVQIFQYLKEKN